MTPGCPSKSLADATNPTTLTTRTTASMPTSACTAASAFNPQSRFYRALHLSYPNADDLLRAREFGVAPGGDIEIHGLPQGFAHYDPPVFYKDWTDGCIAVSNQSMDAIWTRVALGTAVEIRA